MVRLKSRPELRVAGWNREIEVLGPVVGWRLVAAFAADVKHERTICEGTTSDWVCLSQCGGAIEACGAGGELGDGVHDDC
jgi:hypothetical protein